MISSDEVAGAFLAVPREKFISGVLAEEGLSGVYRDDAFATKPDPRGMPLSSSSQPALMARMLELLELRPGHRVLEIGAGTGYNAVLMSHLVGPNGRVTSIDIDPQLVREAAERFATLVTLCHSSLATAAKAIGPALHTTGSSSPPAPITWPVDGSSS